MVASFLAKSCPEFINLLICDRTFASLDSVGSRILGSWAGYGLKYGSLWFSDAVSDYLVAKCVKVILQVSVILHSMASVECFY